MWIIWVIGLALIIAGGVGIYNIGTSDAAIQFVDIIPPACEVIAGGFFIKFGTSKE